MDGVLQNIIRCELVRRKYSYSFLRDLKPLYTERVIMHGMRATGTTGNLVR